MALGFRFEHGISVTEDCSASVLYYEQPARATIEYIEKTYGMDTIEKTKLNLMGPYSIDKNMQVATPSDVYQSADFVDWIVQQGSYGDASSLNYLGSSYMQGNGKIERDYFKARSLFERSISLDEKDSTANYNLGLLAMLGLG